MEVMTMKKFVAMYAKFTFIILLLAIIIPPSIVFDIVKDIICIIILLFWNKFDMTVMRADIAEIIEGKRVDLKNTLNAFEELIDGIIED
jgi:hypothetical protein